MVKLSYNYIHCNSKNSKFLKFLYLDFLRKQSGCRGIGWSFCLNGAVSKADAVFDLSLEAAHLRTWKSDGPFPTQISVYKMPHFSRRRTYEQLLILMHIYYTLLQYENNYVICVLLWYIIEAGAVIAVMYFFSARLEDPNFDTWSMWQQKNDSCGCDWKRGRESYILDILLMVQKSGKLTSWGW